MKLGALQRHFNQQLSGYYPENEVRSFFIWLAESYLEITASQLLVKKEVSVSEKKIELFNSAIRDLQAYKPIQYIVGETEFYGLRIQVNHDVLIPRPETEELVDWVLKDLAQQENPSLQITEIGTGSGCIAISLAKHNAHIQVAAIDISKQALQLAKQNANYHQVNVEWIEQDVLQLERLPKETHIIVSNPPYVKEDEKHLISPNVLNFEPHIALFVKDTSSLLFYEKIIALALRQAQVPTIYVEINQALAEETSTLFIEAGFHNVELKKDMFGKNRMIKATF